MTKIEKAQYVPTKEQVEAAKARREQQQKEKAARKNKAGGKTVRSKNGTYKSVTVTPGQVEAKQKQRIEQKLKEQQHYGGRTIFDKKTGKYVSQSADEVKNIAENKQFQKKSGTLLGKLGKFAKKAGKFGLIGLVGAALISGAAYAIGKLLSGDDKVKEDKTPAPAPTQPDKTNPKEENKPAPTNPDDKTDPKDKVNPNPVPTNPDDKTDPKDKVNPNPVPTNPDDKTDPKDKVNPNPAPTNPDDKTDPDPAKSKTEHVVVKGDNVWNIAKQHLKEMNPDPNYKPTNAEILKHTQELMELNQLKFEPDGYVVLIRPNDRIKLVA